MTTVWNQEIEIQKELKEFVHAFKGVSSFTSLHYRILLKKVSQGYVGSVAFSGLK